MRTSYTNLMQSKYFNPAFNCAIFDGPVRIYFAQFQEEEVLKIYFMIQQKLASEINFAKERSKSSGANILIMAYPNIETFGLSFEMGSKAGLIEVEKWNEDVVVGLCGTLEDHQIDGLVETLRLTMENWRPEHAVPSLVSAESC